MNDVFNFRVGMWLDTLLEMLSVCLDRVSVVGRYSETPKAGNTPEEIAENADAAVDIQSQGLVAGEGCLL